MNEIGLECAERVDDERRIDRAHVTPKRISVDGNARVMKKQGDNSGV
jgi:hypothetical protein